MELKLELDLNNPTHVRAMQEFFNVFAQEKTDVADTQLTLDLAEATEEEVEKAKPAQKRSRSKAKVESQEMTNPEVMPEQTKEEAEKETQAPEKEETDTDSDETITIDAVRALLATKVAANKAVIKKKLSDFGAPNVTKLDQKHYAEMITFLNSLK